MLSIKFNNQIPLSLVHCNCLIDAHAAVRGAIEGITIATFGVEKPNTLLLPNTRAGTRFKRYLDEEIPLSQGVLDLEFIEVGVIGDLPSHLSNLWMTIAVFDRYRDPLFFPMSASIKVLY